MARKETSIDVKGFETTFLVQKRSRLQATPSGSGYYSFIRHYDRGVSLPNSFVASFNSQVNPTILPGSTPVGGRSTPPLVQTGYILSELGDSMITENDNNLIIE